MQVRIAPVFVAEAETAAVETVADQDFRMGMTRRKCSAVMP
jgi:hypothetical protein